MTDTTTTVTPATDEEIERARKWLIAHEWFERGWERRLIARIDAERQQHAIARRQLNSETERWGKVIAERDATIARLTEALATIAQRWGCGAGTMARAALEEQP